MLLLLLNGGGGSGPVVSGLIVETGAGLLNADSYVSVADADAYHLKRGNSAWASLETSAKDAALRKATDFMGQLYGGRWKGARVSAEQALDWPRYGAYANGFDLPINAVPAAVRNAAAELALRAAAGSLTTDVGRLKESVTVGPISTTYVAGASAQTKYTAVDNMLAAYLGSSGSMVKVLRA